MAPRDRTKVSNPIYVNAGSTKETISQICGTELPAPIELEPGYGICLDLDAAGVYHITVSKPDDRVDGGADVEVAEGEWKS